jgi:hypothetical protein
MIPLTLGAVFDGMGVDLRYLTVQSLRECDLAPSNGGLFL